MVESRSGTPTKHREMRGHEILSHSRTESGKLKNLYSFRGPSIILDQSKVFEGGVGVIYRIGLMDHSSTVFTDLWAENGRRTPGGGVV